MAGGVDIAPVPIDSLGMKRARYTKKAASEGLAIHGLILGGVSSGKSGWAENWAQTQPWPVTFVATALATDEEMRRRIERHQKRRPLGWDVIEDPGRAMHAASEVPDDRLVLVDGLGMALALQLDDESAWWDDLGHFCRRAGPALVVSELAGQGLVPTDPASRRFLDLLGQSQQELARWATHVVQVTAGLPWWLKGEPAS